MVAVPTVVASVTFLRHEDGGRSGLACDSRKYRPHLVVGDPNQRTANIAAAREINERYLGVNFTGDDTPLSAGVEHVVTLALSYFPDVDYSGLVAGATFTIREGPKVVGFGCILNGQPNRPLQPTSGGPVEVQ